MAKTGCPQPQPWEPQAETRQLARTGIFSLRRCVKTSLLCVILSALALLSLFYDLSAGSPWRLRPGLAEGGVELELPPHGFSWDDIEPATSLQYTSCFSWFQCARLLVPLNWNATAEEQEDGPRAAIAIIRLPARVPVTDPRYGGPVVLNPGGPGESGVFQVISDGQNLQTILDADADPKGTMGNDKFFDVVSFDPRGVNNTTPRLRCFPNEAEQVAWVAGSPDYGMLWHSESVIGMEWARASALGASCSYGEDETGILRHLNTAQTIEDMLHIVEKAGEWRAQEAEKLLLSDGAPQGETARDVMGRVSYRPGEEMLQYWGMSYGTLIGSTFAAMHPDRVGRIVIDGVVDPADHYSGSWLTQLQDSDGIVAKFCEFCFQAGPGRCPIYLDSPKAIEARLTTILMSFKENPIAVLPPGIDGKGPGPSLVTYGDAHLLLLSAMYFPYVAAEDFFDMLLAVESRNSTSSVLVDIVTRKQSLIGRAGCQPGEPPLGNRAPYVSGLGPFQAISCMDMDNKGLTRESLNEYLTELHGQGKWIAPSWARNKLSCLGYTARPAWRPALTFETQEWSNTSHPLLIIGNSHDTVTPLRNARRVATLFPGSVVLHQDSEGHCSHSSPSLCTAKTIRRYFQTGELPSEGTVCQPETRPFLGCTAEGQSDRDQCTFNNKEDIRLWAAVEELADPFGVKRQSIF